MRYFIGIAFISLLLSCGAEQQESAEVEKVSTPEVEEMDDPSTSPFGTQLLHWTFNSEFTAEQQEMLKTWIEIVGEATIETLGQYPFDVHVSFEQTTRNTPVSFGHTVRKGKQQGLNFYVNPKFELEDFLADWTAPHEIAHLSMPFVGRTFKWYAEGYATYLSRKIMINMDLLNESEFDSIYYNKIHNTMQWYSSPNLTFPEVSDSLLEHYEYGTMYWGSTSFFMTSDSLLQERHNMRFTDVVAAHQSNGRLEDEYMMNVIHSYDDIIGDTLFKPLMDRYRNEPSGSVMKGY